MTPTGGSVLSATEGAARMLSEVLIRRGLTLVLAESCTGGLVSAAVTSIPGSSSWFWGGVVSYANSAKEKMLTVPSALLSEHGAVSAQAVRAMAKGALKISRADLAAAVSGIAGPEGGSPDKPVGTVWIAFASKDGQAREELLSLSGDRGTIRETATVRVLEGLSVFAEKLFKVLP